MNVICILFVGFQYTGLGAAAEARFTPTGALWMLGKPEAENEAMVQRLAKFNVEAKVMDADAVQARWPVIDTTPYPEYCTSTGDIVEKDHGRFSAVHEVTCPKLCASFATSLHSSSRPNCRWDAGTWTATRH